MTRPGTRGEVIRSAADARARAILLLPLLFGAVSCGSAATTFLRVTGPAPLEEPAPPCGEEPVVAGDAAEATPVPARGSCENLLQAGPRGLDQPGPAIRPEEPRPPEAPSATDRRASATFPYIPRRVSCEEVARIAREAALAEGVETGLLIGVMRVESAFASNAISGATAVGLTQVLPWIGEKLACGDLFDPRSNAACGAKVLARWLERFDGNLVSALSGYNAGNGMPSRAREERRVPKNFQYVEDVLRNRSRFLRRGCTAWDQRSAR